MTDALIDDLCFISYLLIIIKITIVSIQDSQRIVNETAITEFDHYRNQIFYGYIKKIAPFLNLWLNGTGHSHLY